jgi:ribonuclease J
MATQGTIVIVLTTNKENKLVAGPELISRGFVYHTTGVQLFDEIKAVIKANYSKINSSNPETFMTELRTMVKNLTSEVIYTKTEKSPIVIPVILLV